MPPKKTAPKKDADDAMVEWAKQNREKRLAEEARKEHGDPLKTKPFKRKDGLTPDEYRIKKFVAREEARLAGSFTKQHDIDSEFGTELSSPIQEELGSIDRRLKTNKKARDETTKEKPKGKTSVKKTITKTPQKKTTRTGSTKSGGTSSTKKKPEKRKRDSDADAGPPAKQPKKDPKGKTGKQVTFDKDIPEKHPPAKKLKSPLAKKPAAKPVKKSTGTKKTGPAAAPAADPGRERKCKSMAVREKKLCKNKGKEGSDHCAVHAKNPKPPQDDGNGGDNGGVSGASESKKPAAKKAPAEVSENTTGNKK